MHDTDAGILELKSFWQSSSISSSSGFRSLFACSQSAECTVEVLSAIEAKLDSSSVIILVELRLLGLGDVGGVDAVAF